MHIAVISPTALLKRFSAYGDVEMALAHLVLSDDAYARYYRAASDNGRYVILDNGLFELKEAMSINDVIAAARRIGASEVICRDVLYDGLATVEATEEFIARVTQAGLRVRFQAVPQGTTSAEWFNCLRALVRLPIHCVGISKLSVPKCFPSGGDIGQSRIDCLADPRWGEIGHDEVSELHLLGGHDRLIKELGVYRARARAPQTSTLAYRRAGFFIRSNDSSVAVWRGLSGLEFDPVNGIMGGLVSESTVSENADPVDFKKLIAPTEMALLEPRILRNIAVWHAVAKDVDPTIPRWQL